MISKYFSYDGDKGWNNILCHIATKSIWLSNQIIQFWILKKIVIRLSKASRIYWQVEMKVPLKYTMNKPSSSYQKFHDGWMQEI